MILERGLIREYKKIIKDQYGEPVKKDFKKVLCFQSIVNSTEIKDDHNLLTNQYSFLKKESSLE